MSVSVNAVVRRFLRMGIRNVSTAVTAATSMADAVIIIVHAATAHISRSSNSRPTGTAADDFGLHMINCHIWHLLSMLPATADKALGRAHEPRRGYHCLIYQVVSKCALRDEKLLVSTSVRFF